jgi:hypothetical protein
VDAQKGEVVACDGGKGFVVLYVESLVEGLGHQGEVDTETACEVDEGVHFAPAPSSSQGSEKALDEGQLVASGLLAGTLLHIEMGRIDNSIAGGPGGKFTTCGLAALYLLQGSGEVNLGIAASG